MNTGEFEGTHWEKLQLQKEIFDVKTRPSIRSLFFVTTFGENVPRKSSIKEGRVEKLTHTMGELIADSVLSLQIRSVTEFGIRYRRFSPEGNEVQGNEGRYLYAGTLVGLTGPKDMKLDPQTNLAEFPLLHFQEGFTSHPPECIENVQGFPYITLPDFVTGIKTDSIGFKIR